MELQEMTKLRKLAIQVLVHGIKSFLQLFFGQLADRIMRRVVIHVRKENCLREWRFNMFARTTITVSACTNLAGKMSDCQKRVGRRSTL